MARKSKAISDALYDQAKKSLKEMGRSGEAGRRLQAIISAKTKGITAVSEVYGITRTTLMSWIRKFEKESTQGLSIKAGRGRKTKIGSESEPEIRKMIQENPNITIDELRIKITQKFGVTLGRSTVHRLMKKLSFSYITPRPRHYKSNVSLQEDFKKKSPRRKDSQPHKRLFFFDESRFGTHSKIGHAWLETGKRTPMPVKLGFKNFYLYSAVELGTGDHFTLEICHVNTICLNVFLEELSRAYPLDQILLVMDGAGWHKSKNLLVPANVEIIYLPPYSPELNPVERFWEHIKKYTIRNKIYPTISSIKDAVANFINNLPIDDIKSLCSANYLYS